MPAPFFCFHWITVQELSAIMKVFCLLSDRRVFNSKSPAMFMSVMQRSGIDAAYVPFMVEPDNIGRALESLKILNIAGANVTVPYQEAIIPYLDELSEGARFIGAVNTIVCNGAFLKGYNTNAIGFMDALKETGFNVDGKTALVFGTGGLAKAVVFILNWLRAASVTVAGRDLAKAEALVHHLAGEAAPLEAIVDRPVRAELIVNCTSVSSLDESREFAELVESLDMADCRLLIDMNYGRTNNFWQTKALGSGIPFTDGLSALAFQSCRTFALWTGIQVGQGEFLDALGNGA
jgi:shikimate dehydrogenase